MLRPCLGRPTGAALLLAMSAAASPAQDSTRSGVPLLPALPVGSEAEDRERLLQLRGARPTTGTLARSLSSRLGLQPADSLTWGIVAPELLVVDN